MGGDVTVPTAPTSTTLWTASGNYADAFAGGDGTEGNPWQIATPAQLARLAYLINTSSTNSQYRDDYYVQTANLDMIAHYWDAIGTSSYYFRGHYDGNGYTISGLITQSGSSTTYNYQGLFGYVQGTQTSPVVIENVNVIGNIRGNQYVGGIIGYAYSSGTISNCSFAGEVTASREMGGIVGGANSLELNISACINMGNITGNPNSSLGYVGGIIGDITEGVIQNCYNTGSVSGSESVGGIVGRQTYDTIIANCYNLGAISGENRVGGIVGHLSYGDCYNCYNLGSVTATDNYLGGVIGYENGTARNNYYGGDCPSTVGGLGDFNSSEDVAGEAEYLSTIVSDAKSENWYSSSLWNSTYPWDFENTWVIVEGYNNGYPMLQNDNLMLEGDVYNVGGQTLYGYILNGVEYAEWNGNWYMVEPIRWRLTGNASQSDGYGTSDDTLAVMDKIVYLGQFANKELEIGEGYLFKDEDNNYQNNALVDQFITESGSGLTYIENEETVNYNQFLSSFNVDVESFGENGITTNVPGETTPNTQSARIFISSIDELNTVCDGNLDVAFSDLVMDMLIENNQLMLYYTRNLGDNVDNIICLNRVGGEVQRKSQDILGVRFTIMVSEYGCVS